MATTQTAARWQVDSADFPAGAAAGDVLRFLLRYAVLAPSSHNTQPWLFRLHGRAVDLHADRARRLPVVDPDDRELTMSCGAALYTLRLALAAFAVDVWVTELPRPAEPDLLARVELTGSPAPGPTPDEATLFAAITRRHTSRARFEPDPVPDAVVGELRAAARAEGAWLYEVPGWRHAAVAKLLARADRLQMADPAFRAELAHWLRPSHTHHDDGIPGYALGRGEIESVVAPLVVRTFDMGAGQAASDEHLLADAPLLAVLGTLEDTVASWLRAGQALQRVLLTATALGLEASFLNQPIEVPTLRRHLARDLGVSGLPQLLLRIGHGPRGSTTPRRPVADVLRRTT
jgi:Nitroreductase family